MHTDVWYELMLRELSAGPDGPEELRREAQDAAEGGEYATEDGDPTSAAGDAEADEEDAASPAA